MDNTENSQPPANPPFAAPAGSAELPERDGYYWMLNTVDEGRAIWRIVNVFSRGHPERNGMQRIARDPCSVFTQEDLSDWQGVQFHGPLIPPNDQAHLPAPGGEVERKKDN